MGKLSVFELVTELIGTLALPTPLPHEDDTAAYGPWADAKFLRLLGLPRNPLCPAAQGHAHPMGWTDAETAELHVAISHYFGRGQQPAPATKTARVDMNRARRDWGPGSRQMYQLAYRFRPFWRRRVMDELDIAGCGLDSIMSQRDEVPTEGDLAGLLTHAQVIDALLEATLKCPAPAQAAFDDLARSTRSSVITDWAGIIHTDRALLQKLLEPLPKLFQKVDDRSLDAVKLPDVRRFVRALAPARTHIGTRDWPVDRALIGKYVNFCDQIGAALGVHTQQERTANLPKSFLSMLQALEPQDAAALEQDLQELVDADSAMPDPFEQLPRESVLTDATAWLTPYDEPGLWRLAGVSNGKIPGMVEYIHPNIRINSWATGRYGDIWKTELAKAKANQPSELKPFRLTKIQFMGTIQMAVWYMHNEGGLLLDDVGVGKTMQAFAFCALLRYWHLYFAQHQRLPGELFAGTHYRHNTPGCTGKADCPVIHHDCSQPGAHAKCTGDAATCTVRTQHGNIPNRPFLVTGAPSIVQQWEEQARWVLMNGHITPVPFLVSSAAVRSVIVNEHLFNPTSRLHWYGNISMLLIVSTKVLETEFAEATGWTAAICRTKKAYCSYPAVDPTRRSLYSLPLNAAFHDEAHNVRTPGSAKYHAIHMISTMALVTICMTATPVVTSVENIIPLACIIGLELFNNPEQFELLFAELLRAVKTAMAQASAARRRALASMSDEEKEIARGNVLITGGRDAAIEAVTNVAVSVALQFRKHIRNVIRRTLADVGVDESVPCGMVIRLQLRAGNWERAMTKTMLQKLLPAANVPLTMGLSRNFYGNGKQCAIHPSLALPEAGLDPEKFPISRTQFGQHPSAKLQAALDLVCAHMGDRQLPPQQVTSKNGVHTWRSIPWDPPLAQDELARDAQRPQKILVYTYYILAASMMKKVCCTPAPLHLNGNAEGHHDQLLELYGITVCTIDGSRRADQRADTLQSWRDDVQGAVLIISAVGSAGLNLQEADVLIILDPTWSSSDTAQLEGRIRRKGQQSRTIVYELKTENSADTVIYAIGEPKKDINDMFLGNKDIATVRRLSMGDISRDITPAIEERLAEKVLRAKAGHPTPQLSHRPPMEIPYDDVDLRPIKIENEKIMHEAHQPPRPYIVPPDTHPTQLGGSRLDRTFDSSIMLASLSGSQPAIPPFARISVAAYGGGTTEPGTETSLLAAFRPDWDESDRQMSPQVSPRTPSTTSPSPYTAPADIYDDNGGYAQSPPMSLPAPSPSPGPSPGPAPAPPTTPPSPSLTLSPTQPAASSSELPPPQSERASASGTLDLSRPASPSEAAVRGSRRPAIPGPPSQSMRTYPSGRAPVRRMVTDEEEDDTPARDIPADIKATTYRAPRVG
ncbi:hypothetical protein AURDEDRAFT_130637 [Auricularia subglabra TFB-10046 SS5]|uniref:Helicase C-terminal domain-containing protein n=1 Tax=Auricularia subglabra (strain TFB-10046 / SS5) TaxID=717982 RepID=J0LES4_AURST|nr:hypothetical protein AURDEDRAFT_130637 [Auricularia subglabra TFB-10046 SS5]